MSGRMCPASWFKLLIKLVGFICYLVHMYFIFYNQVFPSETFTRLVEKQLDHIEFPVIFKLCVTPAQCSPLSLVEVHCFSVLLCQKDPARSSKGPTGHFLLLFYGILRDSWLLCHKDIAKGKSAPNRGLYGI